LFIKPSTRVILRQYIKIFGDSPSYRITGQQSISAER